MRVLADLAFEQVVLHTFCTEESCEKYGLGTLTDTKTMSIEYARMHAHTHARTHAHTHMQVRQAPSQ